MSPKVPTCGRYLIHIVEYMNSNEKYPRYMSGPAAPCSLQSANTNGEDRDQLSGVLNSLTGCFPCAVANSEMSQAKENIKTNRIK